MRLPSWGTGKMTPRALAVSAVLVMALTLSGCAGLPIDLSQLPVDLPFLPAAPTSDADPGPDADPHTRTDADAETRRNPAAADAHADPNTPGHDPAGLYPGGG